MAEDLCQQGDPKGKTSHGDGENFDYMRCDGRTDGVAFSNEDVKSAYTARGEEQVPLGVSGTMVAVDWDSCVADGACIEACPVQVFQWYRTEKDVPAKDIVGQTFAGTGLSKMDERLDYTDKLQTIREHDCIWCMACQEICPKGAIFIESASQEWHKKAAGSYVMMKSTSVNPHAHD